MAHVLAARGLRAGDRLVVQLPNGLEFLDLFLACLRLGVIFVPVSVLYREREVGHIVGDAEPVAVVTTPDLAGLVPGGTPVWDVDELAGGPADPRHPRDEATRDDRARGARSGSELVVPSPDPRGRGRTRDDTARRDRLHVGHDRPGQGRGAHPREPRRQRPHAGRGLAHHRRRPLSGRPAALPRPRPRQRRLLVARERLPHAARRALRARQGRGPLRGVPAHAVLRRADGLRPPARAAGRGRAADRGADAALRVRLGAASRSCLRGLPEEVRPRDPRALRDDRDADDDRQPVRRRAAAGDGRPAAAGCRGAHRGAGGPGRRGGRERRVAGARAGGLRRLLAAARGHRRRLRGRVVSHRRPRRRARPTATSPSGGARAT